MSALVVSKRTKDGWVKCTNGCLTALGGAGQGWPRKATHEVSMAGYPTPVCEECARAWQRIWDGALDSARDMRTQEAVTA